MNKVKVEDVAERIVIDGKEFIVECNVMATGDNINSLRKYYHSATYGYYSYRKQDGMLTEEEYQENIDQFMKEFEKRLDISYLRNVVKTALKKNDGSFHKNRVYDEYILDNAVDNGMGVFNLTTIRFKTMDHLVIKLTLHHTSEPQRY